MTLRRAQIAAQAVRLPYLPTPSTIRLPLRGLPWRLAEVNRTANRTPLSRAPTISRAVRLLATHASSIEPSSSTRV